MNAASRRDLFLAPLLTAADAKAAADPDKTVLVPAGNNDFEPSLAARPGSIKGAHLVSKSSAPGIYLKISRAGIQG